MRLLLVEDEDAIRFAVSRALNNWGHEVAAAASLAAGREAARATAPAALVTDLKLPDGGGLELARELGVPFVVMSGYASFDDAVDALRLGCVDFLTKPVAMKTLQASVARLADRCSAWDMCVIAPGRSRLALARPGPAGVEAQDIAAQELTWSDRSQARERFSAADHLLPTIRERQLLAELLQAAEAGRLVVNRGPTWWRAWLEATVDWQADETACDRQRLIRDLADRVLFTEEGTVVECSHAAG